MLLTNYRGSGIGDFGAELAEALRRTAASLTVEETAPSGSAWRVQLARARDWPGPLIANLGLTGWGPSPVRNFFGFRALAQRFRAGRVTVVLVHHAIEMLADASSGFRVSPLVRWGAHRALAGLTGAPAVVFTPTVAALLQEQYGWRAKVTTPIPSPPTGRRPHWDGSPPTVVGLGYWAPYKGIDTFLSVAARLKGKVRFILAGTPHRVLSDRRGFRREVTRWTFGARAAGVETPGYVSGGILAELLRGRVIAFLPYEAASGASASLATLAGYGVPALTSDLPEFRYVEAQGGAVQVLTGEAGEYAERISAMLSDQTWWEASVDRQVEYARAHSWESLSRTVLSLTAFDAR